MDNQNTIVCTTKSEIGAFELFLIIVSTRALLWAENIKFKQGWANINCFLVWHFKLLNGMECWKCKKKSFWNFNWSARTKCMYISPKKYFNILSRPWPVSSYFVFFDNESWWQILIFQDWWSFPNSLPTSNFVRKYFSGKL